MHPFFHETMVRANERELERRVRAPRLRWETPPPAAPGEPVTLRLARPQDEEALRRLSALEGRPDPAGPHVVAEIGGDVVAALPLGPGRPMGDPFRPTDHLVPLLELRAKQLTAAPSHRRPVAFWGAIRGWSRV
jgi:hypothetical protein